MGDGWALSSSTGPCPIVLVEWPLTSGQDGLLERMYAWKHVRNTQYRDGANMLSLDLLGQGGSAAGTIAARGVVPLGPALAFPCFKRALPQRSE
jgi:hypothetical protein